jgi:glucose-6-phosphate 1-dehydrogenase
LVANSNEQPTAFILYGATGDLAKRMVLPAFYELFTRGLLPRRWKLVGNSRRSLSHEDFRRRVYDSLTEFAETPEPKAWEEFSASVMFAGGSFREDDPGSMLDVLAEVRSDLGEEVTIVHYLAIPPQAFAPTTKAIKAHDLAKNAKAVYEKPYGTSLQSFYELDELVHTVFDEEQVYRIDHFLGKEATQNLHLARFANRVLANTWNHENIAQVQIDVPESLDIADRAEFYDQTGAALDMLVTHLFQVAAEVAMEPPADLSAQSVLDARETVIAAFRPLNPDEVVLGQFRSYRQTPGIPPDSTTDTYVAARLWIDTDRWLDVPFVLRTGKKLAADAQRVSLIYKQAEGPVRTGKNANVLTFDLKGSGAIEFEMTVKKPGPDPVPADSCTSLMLANVAEGAMAPYTSLLHDVLIGDRSLFTTSAGLEAAFRAFEPLLSDQRPDIVFYDDYSWGPPEADKLTGDIGWHLHG